MKKNLKWDFEPLEKTGRAAIVKLDATKVARQVEQQRGDAGHGFHQPGGRRAGLGHAEVERMVGLRGEQAVGLDH